MKEKKNNKSKILKYIIGGTVFTFITAGSLKISYDAFKTPHMSYQLKNKLENTNLVNDSESLRIAEELDECYSVKEAFYKLAIGNKEFDTEYMDNLYQENKEIKENINYQDFEQAINNSINNIFYINRSGGISKISNELLASIKKDIINDYITIREYIDENYEKDFDFLYNRILSNKLEKIFDENGIESFSLDNVAILDKNNERHAKFDITINGEKQSFLADQKTTKYIYNIQNCDNGKSFLNIQNLLDASFIYDKEKNEIHDQVADDKTTNILIGCYSVMILSLCVGLISVVPITYKKLKDLKNTKKR